VNPTTHTKANHPTSAFSYTVMISAGGSMADGPKCTNPISNELTKNSTVQYGTPARSRQPKYKPRAINGYESKLNVNAFISGVKGHPT
jgi:hypothetical protein